MMIKTGFATIVLLLLSSTAFAADSRATVSEDDERIVLEYDRAVRAIIEPRHGGELAGLSVFMRGEWHELIYRAADYSEQPGWRGKAPLLWPATGVSISESGGRGSYMAGVGLYKMPMHGFARAQAWRIVETTSGANSAAATLELVDTDASRRLYPFGFSLRAEYRVDPCGLEIRYHVAASAANEAPMPFSIGNHVTFRLPLVNGSAPEATTFRTNLPQEYIIDAKRVFTGQARPSRLTGTHRVGGSARYRRRLVRPFGDDFSRGTGRRAGAHDLVQLVGRSRGGIFQPRAMDRRAELVEFGLWSRPVVARARLALASPNSTVDTRTL